MMMIPLCCRSLNHSKYSLDHQSRHHSKPLDDETSTSMEHQHSCIYIYVVGNMFVFFQQLVFNVASFANIISCLICINIDTHMETKNLETTT